MCLKQIKLAGFKSFVDPTVIRVNQQVNAIVGPNGCGKSNIVDAIRWVIGEISAKKLRGQSMSDVIFAGTSGRKPVGKASVELIFDNSDGRFGGEYSGFGEFSIRREVTREGSSSYYINSTACRRRDVLDLFLGTGLGSRSYSVIEQGMISNLIEAKPEDLRGHIGEVAGISKYKERRRETETRISHTRDNLDRLNDLRDEIDKQLRHLQRQANAARKFKEYQAERAELGARVKAMHWRDIEQKLEQQDKLITTAKIERETTYEEIRQLETATASLREEQSGLNDQLQEKQKAFYNLSNEVGRLEQRIRSAESALSRSSDELIDNETAQEEYTELLSSYQEKIASLETELESLLPQQNQVEEERETCSFALTKAQDAVNFWRQTTDQLQSELMQLRTQEGVCQNKLQYFIEQQASQAARREAIVAQMGSLQIEQVQSELAPLEEALFAATHARDEKSAEQQRVRETQQQLRSQLQSLRNEQKDIRKQLAQKERELATQQARQEAALTKDDAHANAFIDRNNLGSQPRLVETLQVQEKWQRAVEAVLQPQLDAICVDRLTDYSDAIEAMKSGQLMLVDGATQQSTWQPRLNQPTLLQQIESNWPLSAWLTGIYVADNIEQARSMRSSLIAGESIVTPEGHWLGADWWQINIPQEESQSILGRESVISDLQAQVNQLTEQEIGFEEKLALAERELRQTEDNLDQLQQNLSALNQQLSTAQQAMARQKSDVQALVRQKEQAEKDLQQLASSEERIKTELAQNKKKLEIVTAKLPELEAENEQQLAQRDELNQALATAQQQAARADQKVGELNIQVSSCENQLKLLKESSSRDEKRQVALQEREEELREAVDTMSIDIPEMRDRLDHMLAEKQRAEETLRENEEKRNSQNWQSNEHESRRKELQKVLEQMQDSLTKLQMEREGLSVRQATVVEQLEETGVNLEHVLQHLPQELDLAEQEARLEKISNSIARLGAINLAAIEEFDEAKERQDYLNKQHSDLMEAIEMLEKAIEKIDRESRQKFKQTFELVNANFQRLFPEVFGGGSATLELTENDWLTAGVIVRAQPPGKRNTTIHLLSGGEKALTALALVFSMFKLNPAPFCILDEVDAPLDDLNVGRFSDLVRKMAEDTQFLMISHNKLAIAMSDQLLGITMQEPGVSRLVSVDMGEAMEMVEA